MGDDKMDIKNTMRMRELIHLAQNSDQCKALVNIARNFRIAQNATKLQLVVPNTLFGGCRHMAVIKTVQCNIFISFYSLVFVA